MRVQEAGLAYFRRALELHPTEVTAVLNSGLAYEALGRWTEALDMFSRAAMLKPNSSSALLGRGNVMYRLGRPYDAVLAYQLRCRPTRGTNLTHDAIACGGSISC